MFHTDDKQPPFAFWVDIVKSYTQASANGGDSAAEEYIVEGLASVTAPDEQGETIEADGLEINYLLNYGWIKYEHSKDPSAYIGKALEAKIINTEHGRALWLKARLLKGNPLVEKLWNQLKLLKETGLGRYGFSIEGNAIKRDQRNPKRVLKAIVRNVAITPNPVNAVAFCDIAKSLDLGDPEALVFETDAPDVEKAMDTVSGAPVMPESLEASPKEQIGVLRTLARLFSRAAAGIVCDRSTFCRKLTDAGANGGLADQLTHLLYGRLSGLAKSLEGGESQGMPDFEELMKRFTDGIDVLEKSVAPTPPAPPAEDEEDTGEGDVEEEDGGINEDEGADEEPTEDDDDDEGSTDDGDEPTEDDDEQVVEKAIEVSPFLAAIARKIDRSLDVVAKALGTGDLNKSLNTANAQMFRALGEMEQLNFEMLKSLTGQFTQLAGQVTQMQETMSTIGQLPAGRRSVQSVSGQPAPTDDTLTKSLNGNYSFRGQQLSKSMVSEKLFKGFQKGHIPAEVISTFETGGPLPKGIWEQVKDL